MVDKTNPESTDSAAQKLSEELFLARSDDEVLRKKVDDENLKLDDSQEEMFLQNIHRGSEQSEDPNKGIAHDAGTVRAGVDENIEINSQPYEGAEDSKAEEILVDVTDNENVSGSVLQNNYAPDIHQELSDSNNESVHDAAKQFLSDGVDATESLRGSNSITVDSDVNTNNVDSVTGDNILRVIF
jgi:hypothetical protein